MPWFSPATGNTERDERLLAAGSGFPSEFSLWLWHGEGQLPLSGFVRKTMAGGDMAYETGAVASHDIFLFKKLGQNSDEPAPGTENLGDQTI
jgi:hypothetical protein